MYAILNLTENVDLQRERSRVLRQAGFHVLEAGSDNEAIDLIKKHSPPVAIVERSANHAATVELCRKIKSDSVTAATQVLCLAPLRDGIEVQKSILEAGADWFLATEYSSLLPETIENLVHAWEIEERLRISERRLNLALQVNRMGLWERDLASGTTHISDELEVIFGLPPGEGKTNPMSLEDRIHPEDADLAGRFLTQAETITGREFRILLPDGECRWVQNHATTVLDEHNTPTRLIGIVQDITSRKQMELALAESEERLALAQSAGGIGTFDWNIPNDRLMWTRQLELIFGLEDGTFEGNFASWRRRIHPEDVEDVECQIKAGFKERAENLTFDYRAIRPDGRVRWLHAPAKVFYDKNGDPQRVLGIVIDVSDRVEAEEESHQRTQEIERSNEELQRFAFAVSHDLQEPLRMILTYSQLLERLLQSHITPETRDCLTFIQGAATRMKSLINDLLEYSRVSGMPLQTRPVSLEGVLATVMFTLHTAIQESSAVVTHDPLPSVLADDRNLTQLLQNLLANAIKYRSDQPPRIHVSANRQNGNWLFSVRDNGIGIDMAYAEQIFQLFKRLHPRTEYEGTGLGLAICRRIVERHGGRIWVESKPGKGSTFYFTLPAATEEDG